VSTDLHDGFDVLPRAGGGGPHVVVVAGETEFNNCVKGIPLVPVPGPLTT